MAISRRPGGVESGTSGYDVKMPPGSSTRFKCPVQAIVLSIRNPYRWPLSMLADIARYKRPVEAPRIPRPGTGPGPLRPPPGAKL